MKNKKMLLLITIMTICFFLNGCNSEARAKYNEAVDLFNAQEYSRAYVLFLEVNKFSKSEEYIAKIAAIYSEAEALLEEYDYYQAAELFSAISTYEDSQERSDAIIKEIDTANEVRRITDEYWDVRMNMKRLNLQNYEEEVTKIENVMKKIDSVDVAEYKELNDYIWEFKRYNDQIRGIIRIDRDSFRTFIFRSTLELSLANSFLYFQGIMGEALNIPFPSKYEKI